MIASLYIHVPFCSGACAYCDFYSIAINSADSRLDAYVERLLCDIETMAAQFELASIPTIYIGGGTPSLLGAAPNGAARMEKILAGLRRFSPGEFTVEANPESASGEFLQVCRDCGVTRISLGVQSFHEPSLRAVNRTGFSSVGAIADSLARVSRYFPGTFSADIISGLPLQTEAILREDINRLLDYNPAHISLYSLTLDDDSPLQKKAPVTDESDALWIAGRDMLLDAGFHHYEVSNFARTNKQSRHNIRYWRMENWLGLGPGASGTVIDDASGTGRRFTVPEDVDGWLASKKSSINSLLEEEFIDTPALIKESILMGFRYAEGVDTELFEKRFGTRIEQAIPRTLEHWRKKNCLAEGKIALNEAGLLLLNRFLTDAFAELDQS